MKKYLYLTEIYYKKSWIEGGKVPLSLASRYVSAEREGVMTKDENLVFDSPLGMNGLLPFISFGPAFQARDFPINGFGASGRVLQDMEINQYYEDGAVLCLSNSCSEETARRFGKQICLRINDINVLKGEVDRQMGVASKMSACKYTDGPERNTFLKSSADSWQDEFRLFWLNCDARDVVLPPGMAEIEAEFADVVKLPPPPEGARDYLSGKGLVGKVELAMAEMLQNGMSNSEIATSLMRLHDLTLDEIATTLQKVRKSVFPSK